MFYRWFTVVIVSLLVLPAAWMAKAGDDDGKADGGAWTIHWDEDKEDLPKPVDSGGNVRVEKIPAGQTRGSFQPSLVEEEELLSETPADSLAAAVAAANQAFWWRPKWRFEGTGGPWLPEVALSADNSLLAIVEKYGERGGPFGSRVVLIDTHQWRVVNIVELGGCDVQMARLVPDTRRMVVWSGRQTVMEHPAELISVNLKTGRRHTVSEPLRQRISSMEVSANGRALLVKPGGLREARLYAVADLSATPRVIETRDTEALLAFSPDDSLFAVAGESGVEVFDSARLRQRRFIELPARAKPTQIEFVGREPTLALLLDDHSAYLIPGSSSSVPVPGGPFRRLFPNELEDELIGAVLRKHEMVGMSLPHLAPTRSLEPLRLRPATKASIILFRHLPHAAAFLAVDEGGHVYLVKAQGRRWRKIMILEPQK